jgi:hypothetical protein
MSRIDRICPKRDGIFLDAGRAGALLAANLACGTAVRFSASGVSWALCARVEKTRAVLHVAVDAVSCRLAFVEVSCDPGSGR